MLKMRCNVRWPVSAVMRSIAGLIIGLPLLLLTPVTQHTFAQELFDYPETGLRGFTSAEFRRPLSDCRKICLDRSGCVGFEHAAATNICRLLAGIDSAQSNSQFNAGTRYRLPNYREPANVPVWHYARVSGVDFWGGDLAQFSQGIEMYDAASCEAACDSRGDCRAYTYNQARNRCFLKSGFDFIQSYSDGISGIYFQAKPSESNVTFTIQWELFLDRDLSGMDIYQAVANTYRECMRQCERETQCRGFTWVTYTRQDQCFLKTGTDLYPIDRGRSGMASGRKSSRTVQPDFIRAVPARD